MNEMCSHRVGHMVNASQMKTILMLTQFLYGALSATIKHFLYVRLKSLSFTVSQVLAVLLPESSSRHILIPILQSGQLNQPTTGILGLRSHCQLIL